MSRQVSRPRPYLAVPLADKRRGRQISPDGIQKVSVRHPWLGPRRCATSGATLLDSRASGIHRRRSRNPDTDKFGFQPLSLTMPADGHRLISTTSGLPKDIEPPFLAQQFVFHDQLANAPGRLANFASSGSFSRSLRPASIPAEARSRHSSSRYMGTDNSREMACTGSPRNSAQGDCLLPVRRPPLHFGGRAGGASSRATRSFHPPRHT